MIVLIATSVLVVSIIIAIAAVVVLWKRKKTAQTAEANYRVFFMMGVILMPAGLSWMVVSLLTELSISIGFPFFIIGVVYLGIGLGNRDRWNNKLAVKKAE